MSWECELCASYSTRANPRVKKERKKERHVEILLCTKKSFHFIVPTHFSSVARARHASSSSFWLLSTLVLVFTSTIDDKALTFGGRIQKKGNKKNSTLINHRFVREREVVERRHAFRRLLLVVRRRGGLPGKRGGGGEADALGEEISAATAKTRLFFRHVVVSTSSSFVVAHHATSGVGGRFAEKS